MKKFLAMLLIAGCGLSRRVPPTTRTGWMAAWTLPAT
jgi:hypothetical protein